MPCVKRRERDGGVVEGKRWLRGRASERAERAEHVSMRKGGKGKRTRFAIAGLGCCAL